MAFGKRQLVLAALVVALGAAVYLNWQFTGDTGGLVEAGGTASEKSCGRSAACQRLGGIQRSGFHFFRCVFRGCVLFG